VQVERQNTLKIRYLFSMGCNATSMQKVTKYGQLGLSLTQTEYWD